MNLPGDLTYGKYLRLDDLLSCQHPVSDVHDEMLFVIIHQVYELWFKQTLHETGLLQRRLESGDGTGALATARRIAKILKTAVGQMDVLETMTPRQFARFRPERRTSFTSPSASEMSDQHATHWPTTSSRRLRPRTRQLCRGRTIGRSAP